MLQSTCHHAPQGAEPSLNHGTVTVGEIMRTAVIFITQSNPNVKRLFEPSEVTAEKGNVLERNEYDCDAGRTKDTRG
jgi:hypothetical protein